MLVLTLQHKIRAWSGPIIRTQPLLPQNSGSMWTSDCLKTPTISPGESRYSFLSIVFPSRRRVLAISGGIDEIGGIRWELLLCVIVMWTVGYFCIWKGVKTTGKVSTLALKLRCVSVCLNGCHFCQVVYVTAIFPYVMLFTLLVRGLSLPGALQGVVFYLLPDPKRLTDPQVGAPSSSVAVWQNRCTHSLCLNRFGWMLGLRSSSHTVCLVAT